MNEDFKNMKTRTPREELNALAGAAGRQGITFWVRIRRKDFVVLCWPQDPLSMNWHSRHRPMPGISLILQLTLQE